LKLAASEISERAIYYRVYRRINATAKPESGAPMFGPELLLFSLANTHDGREVTIGNPAYDRRGPATNS
jgi:hypothetical protein